MRGPVQTKRQETVKTKDREKEKEEKSIKPEIMPNRPFDAIEKKQKRARCWADLAFSPVNPPVVHVSVGGIVVNFYPPADWRRVAAEGNREADGGA